MLRIVAVALLAVGMSVGPGPAQARVSSSLSHAHFPTCSDGLVKQICVCRRAGEVSGARPQLCRSGWYCHTFDGACRQ
jgi:hypothetical protein